MNGKSGFPFQGLVIKLIIINVIMFLIQVFTYTKQVAYSLPDPVGAMQVPALTYYMGLVPALVTQKGYLWQVCTYMFLHDTSGFAHLFFNMYALLLFGIPIEQTWGSKKFLLYYLFCGVGAGITILVISLFSGGMGYWIPTIGASGAVFGLLLAFGMLYPNVEILLFFILPIKAKYLVVLYGLLELYLELFGGETSISHAGHLGGLVFGLLYFVVSRRKGFSFKSRLYRARLEKAAGGRAPAVPRAGSSRDRELKAAILGKLREAGYDSLNDDEVQYIKYLSIMAEGREPDCGVDSFTPGNSECDGCEIDDACFIREVSKYT
ncbi:MAG TPA: rhomboid family intramembrane serine protease [Spirochaetes bacterium]|nr:rhomboid family intramembrane serine protease [Spirochaetota bacterium]